MGKVERFVFQTDDINKLADALEFIVNQLEPKTGFNEINAFGIDKKGYLVFWHLYDNETEEGVVRYPMRVDKTILTQQIANWVADLNLQQLADMGCTSDPYAEEEEVGYELFIPKWYGEHEIDSYECWQTLLAVRPVMIQYGK